MLLDENGEVLARFKDVNSLYEFVKEKTEEGESALWICSIFLRDYIKLTFNSTADLEFILKK